MWQISILVVSWKDGVINEEVWASTGQQNIEIRLRERRLHWLANVMDHTHSKHCIGRSWDSVEDRVDQGQTFKEWDSAGKRQKERTSTDSNGVGVWSNVSTSVIAASHVRSRSGSKISLRD